MMTVLSYPVDIRLLVATLNIRLPEKWEIGAGNYVIPAFDLQSGERNMDTSMFQKKPVMSDVFIFPSSNQ